MSSKQYVDPIHLADVPDKIRAAIAATGDVGIVRDILYSVSGFREFAENCEPRPETSNDLIAACYAYVISDNYACLKVAFLISMIACAKTTIDELASELMSLTIHAIVCLVDVYSSSKGTNSIVSGYVPQEVLPLAYIAGEFVSSFANALDCVDHPSMFDADIDENTMYAECHTSEMETLQRVKAGTETLNGWAAAMSRSLVGMTAEATMKAFGNINIVCSNDVTYNNIIRECLHRKIALMKCTQRLRELAEIIGNAMRLERARRWMTTVNVAALAAAEGTQVMPANFARSSRPCTTPARVQTIHPPRIQRASLHKPAVNYSPN